MLSLWLSTIFGNIEFFQKIEEHVRKRLLFDRTVERP